MRTRTSTAGNRKGFTLLELLVVLFIVGLLGSIVALSAGRMRDNSLFREEARRILLTAKHARETAILGRQDVVFKVDGNRYWLDYGNDRISDLHAVPEKFSLAGKDLFFFAKGNSSGGLIEIQNEKGRRYAIEVNQLLGTASIKRL